MKKRTLNFGLGKVLSGFIGGALTMVMVTGVIAAPTAMPTAGDVNAKFTSAKIGTNAMPSIANTLVSDKIRTTGITLFGTNNGAPLTTDGINLNGKISNYVSGTAFQPVNISKGIKFTDLTGSLGTGYRIEADTSGILDFNNFSRIDFGDIQLNGDYRVFTGSAAYLRTGNLATDFLSPTTQNTNIQIQNGGLLVGGTEIKSTGIKNITVLNSSNPSVTAPVKIDDDLEVTGNINLDGRLNINGNLQTPDNNFFFEKNIRTQLGKTIGRYIKMRSTISGTVSNSGLSSNPSVSVQCPANTQMVACSGNVFSSRAARNEGSWINVIEADMDIYSENIVTCNTTYRYTGSTGDFSAAAEATCFASNDIPVITCEGGGYNVGSTSCKVQDWL
jgi:hypothetical protein